MWTKQEHEILIGKLKQSLAEKDRTIEVNHFSSFPMSRACVSSAGCDN